MGYLKNSIACTSKHLSLQKFVFGTEKIYESV